MTAVDERLAPVVELRPAARRRPPTPGNDLHKQLTEQFDRLLAVAVTTEMTRPDALGDFVGALINRMKPGSGPLSKHELVALVSRVADRLGCPTPTPVYLVDVEVAR